MTKMSRRSFWSAFTAGALCLPALAGLCSGEVHAQSYPTKPVRLIVPFPAGGAIDLTARAFVSVAEQYLGQPVIVVIRAGGGGAVGADAAAKAEPDGYTLFMAEPGSTIILPIAQKTSYASSDFIPLGQIVSLPPVVSVLANSRFQSVADLVKEAKEKPGSIRHSAVNLSPELILYERLGATTGAKFTHVPQTGGGPAMAALLGGEVETYSPYPPVVFPHIQDGRVRGLAVAARERWSTLPNIPTLRELNFDIDEISFWVALFAPKGTPEPIVAKLRDVVAKVVEDPSFKQLMTRMGQPPSFMSAPDFAVKYDKEQKETREIIEKLSK